MRKTILAVMLCLIAGGCYSYKCDELRNANRMKLNKLTIGMTEQEVTQFMGEGKCEDSFINPIGQKWLFASATNPYKKEILKSESKTFEILFYYTDVKDKDNAITDDELTPLVFDDGKLIGWGWSFLEQNIQKYEIRIR